MVFSALRLTYQAVNAGVSVGKGIAAKGQVATLQRKCYEENVQHRGILLARQYSGELPMLKNELFLVAPSSSDVRVALLPMRTTPVTQSTIVTGGQVAVRNRTLATLVEDSIEKDIPVVLLHCGNYELVRGLMSGGASHMMNVVERNNLSYSPFVGMDSYEISRVVFETIPEKYGVKFTARDLVRVASELLYSSGYTPNPATLAACPLLSLTSVINKKINERKIERKTGENLLADYMASQSEARTLSHFLLDLGTQLRSMTNDNGKNGCDMVSAIEHGEGNHTLGGKDWDAELMAYFISQFTEKTGVKGDEIYDDTEVLNELVIKTEEAKKELTNKNSASFTLSMGRGKRAKLEINLEKFNEITRHHLLSTIELTKVALKQAATKTSSKGKPCDQFDEIIFVGGSTRMRQVKEAMKKEFGAEPQIFEPDEAIARGAAMLAQFLVTNPQEADSGAGGMKTGAPSRFGEVTSKSYGIETLVDGKERLSNVILKNDEIPLSNTQTYYTVQANQRAVNIIVYESNIMEKTTELSFGKQIADGKLELPAGLPDEAPLDVTFALDRNGMLTITAAERSRGGKCNIIVKTEGLTESEVLKLRKQTNSIKVTDDADALDTPQPQPVAPVVEPKSEPQKSPDSDDDPWA
jgi:hypothetical protein